MRLTQAMVYVSMRTKPTPEQKLLFTHIDTGDQSEAEAKRRKSVSVDVDWRNRMLGRVV